jgi:hypothetical protein
MSMTTSSSAVSPGAPRSLVAPRKVRAASSSPGIVRASKPNRSRTAAVNASPFSASRTALVSTAVVAVTPSASDVAR